MDQKLIAFFCRASPVLCNLVLSKHAKVSMSKYVTFNMHYVNVYHDYSFFSLKWTDFFMFTSIQLYSLYIFGIAKNIWTHPLLLLVKKDSSALKSCNWSSRHYWAGILFFYRLSCYFKLECISLFCVTQQYIRII